MSSIFSFLANMSHSNSAGILHEEGKLAASKFDKDEICILTKTWQDLAERNAGKGIEKDVFQQYMPMTGLLGDRLFAQFDVKKTGYIDLDEFIIGLSIACRGTKDEKAHFLFDMYNVSHDRTISRQELAILINQVPTDLMHQVSNTTTKHFNDHESEKSSVHDVESVDNEEAKHNHGDHEEGLEHVDEFTNFDLIEQAFNDCDINHEGRLNFEQFKMWLERNPALLLHLESVLPYSGTKDVHVHHDRNETLPHMKRSSASMRLDRGRSNRSNSVLALMDPHNAPLSPSNHSLVSSNSFIRTDSKTELSPPPSSSPSPYSSSTAVHSPTPNGGGAVGGGGGGGAVMGGGIVSESEASTPSSKYQLFTPRAGELSRTSSLDDHVLLLEEEARSHLLQALDLTTSESAKRAIQAVIDGHFSHLASASQLPGLVMTSAALHHRDSVGMMTPAEEATIYHMEGFLFKKGEMFGMLSKRYYVLSGNCIYYYGNQADIQPKGVIFLTGSLIELLDPITDHEEKEMQLKSYYGFELLHQDMCTGEHHRHEKRILYAQSNTERESWVKALRKAAHAVPIEDDYLIEKELGRGRFSVVRECVHKQTMKHCAVKIIEKSEIEPDEKALLRTEIAVLKLVNHPNIIRLEGIYETRKQIFIVMEKLEGGELFEKVAGRPRFSENEAARLLKPLLEALAYLHDLGIVHRDLKPENILCGDSWEDLKIADFGLSKIILPKEKMESSCGTLSYVAPEVLTQQGYGKETDLWSIGVILFLIMCGRLPFDGDDQNEIIKNTIRAEYTIPPKILAQLSTNAKDMLRRLLHRNPKDRISAKDALRHPFITSQFERRRSVTLVGGGGGGGGVSTPMSSVPSTPTTPHPPSSSLQQQQQQHQHSPSASPVHSYSNAPSLE